MLERRQSRSDLQRGQGGASTLSPRRCTASESERSGKCVPVRTRAALRFPSHLALPRDSCGPSAGVITASMLRFPDPTRPDWRPIPGLVAQALAQGQAAAGLISAPCAFPERVPRHAARQRRQTVSRPIHDADRVASWRRHRQRLRLRSSLLPERRRGGSHACRRPRRSLVGRSEGCFSADERCAPARSKVPANTSETSDAASPSRKEKE